MGEKETTISFRMGKEDLQMLEEFMDEHGIDERGRSRLIRDAIAGYISSQGHGSGSAGKGSGIYVRFNEVQMEALRMMVEDGTAFDEEEFIRRCVHAKLVSPEVEADSANRAFKAAQMASKMK